MGKDEKGRPAPQTRTVLPSARMLVPEPNLVSETPARGGRFAEWLVTDSSREPPNPTATWPGNSHRRR
ncbi:MAG: hypothetical protein Ct9H300mP1_26970 [Planctomycetaceae bacterium]|nr:MAG: hypothetical protein Ct9H300mP1_26970 [Planctomycetaceae bacterium]